MKLDIGAVLVQIAKDSRMNGSQMIKFIDS